jgi:nitroreductase
VAVTDRNVLRQIADITDHGKFIAEASCCIAVFCEPVKYYLEDGSAATQNILLAAHAYGLATCWVAGDKKDYCPDIARLLGVPEPYKLVSLVAVGARALRSIAGKEDSFRGSQLGTVLITWS